MNSLDVFLAIFLAIGLFQGFRKGFFIELASLLGLVLGVVGAIYFSHFVAGFLASFTDWSEQTLNMAAFAITFIGIVILISSIAKLLTKTLDLVALGLVNKLLGGLFGVLKTAFFLSVLILFINAIENELSFMDEEKKDASLLYKPVASLAPMVLPKLIKELNEYVNEEEDLEI
ncbi:MAG: CvpA family protein [Flavobacteriaceae bacterium]|nr:CvpA family protein [Flavobacteriaceae bacterium]